MTQDRGSLRETIQQHNARSAGSLVASQYQDLTESGAFVGQADHILADTSGGSITVTLPRGVPAIMGLPFKVTKTSASNTLTVAAAGSDLIEGSATIAVTANHAMVAVAWDGSAWRRVDAGGASSAVGLVAANNLSDVASATTSLANLGGLGLAAKHSIPLGSIGLIAADAEVVYWRAPFAGVLTALTSVIRAGTIATGSAILTPTINGGAVTGGVCTHALAATVGDAQDTAVTASGTFAANDLIRVAVTGTNDGVGTKANLALEVTRTS